MGGIGRLRMYGYLLLGVIIRCSKPPRNQDLHLRASQAAGGLVLAPGGERGKVCAWFESLPGLHVAVAEAAISVAASIYFPLPILGTFFLASSSSLHLTNFPYHHSPLSLQTVIPVAKNLHTQSIRSSQPQI